MERGPSWEVAQLGGLPPDQLTAWPTDRLYRGRIAAEAGIDAGREEQQRRRALVQEVIYWERDRVGRYLVPAAQRAAAAWRLWRIGPKPTISRQMQHRHWVRFSARVTARLQALNAAGVPMGYLEQLTRSTHPRGRSRLLDQERRAIEAARKAALSRHEFVRWKAQQAAQQAHRIKRRAAALRNAPVSKAARTAGRLAAIRIALPRIAAALGKRDRDFLFRLALPFEFENLNKPPEWTAELREQAVENLLRLVAENAGLPPRNSTPGERAVVRQWIDSILTDGGAAA